MKTAWIFDVDGVLTNPLNKRVTDPQVLDHIAKKLEQGELVALNTGLPADRIEEQTIHPLIEKIRNKNILQNLFVVAEKGGIWISFGENNNPITDKDNSLTVPPDLQQTIKNLINERYSDMVFFDQSKLTMITVEVKDECPLDKFEKIKSNLFTDIENILKEKNLSAVFRAFPTTLDVDVENRKAGKGFATRRILEWVKSKEIKPQRYITFGDSFRSDILMAQEIYSHGFPVEFIYVGKENIDISDYPFPIKKTQNKFEKGTLEFLQSPNP